MVVAVWTAPVSVLFSVTETPGITAPLGSETVPAMSPDCRDCAKTGVQSAASAAISTNVKTHLLFIFTFPLRFAFL